MPYRREFLLFFFVGLASVIIWPFLLKNLGLGALKESIIVVQILLAYLCLFLFRVYMKHTNKYEPHQDIDLSDVNDNILLNNREYRAGFVSVKKVLLKNGKDIFVHQLNDEYCTEFSYEKDLSCYSFIDLVIYEIDCSFYSPLFTSYFNRLYGEQKRNCFWNKRIWIKIEIPGLKLTILNPEITLNEAYSEYRFVKQTVNRIEWRERLNQMEWGTFFATIILGIGTSNLVDKFLT